MFTTDKPAMQAPLIEENAMSASLPPATPDDQDRILKELQILRADIKRYSRLTISDGISIGIGLFIILPLLTLVAAVVLMVLGISLMPSMPSR